MDEDEDHSSKALHAAQSPVKLSSTSPMHLPEKLVHPSTQQRPLIDYVTNKWQNELSHGRNFDSEEEEVNHASKHPASEDDDADCTHRTRELLHSRLSRRMLALALILLLTLYYAWSKYVQPRLAEEWLYKEGFAQQQNGTYGLARGGDALGFARIQSLDASLVPGGAADPHGRRRLVFVGDVHGCRAELQALLAAASFDRATDHLILTGDVISKGPDSVGVLDELLRLGATSVRGNHEDRVLTAVAAGAHGDERSAAATSRGAAKDAALIRQLRPRHLRYLRALPLILHVPALPMMAAEPESVAAGGSAAGGAPHSLPLPPHQHILVVHAGLVPGVPLARQDPYYVMNMRSIHTRTHVPSAAPAGGNDDGGRSSSRKRVRPWRDMWGWYNDRLASGRAVDGVGGFGAASGEAASWWGGGWWAAAFGHGGKAHHARPYVVVYGHDSRAGLQLKRWTKGLDSGCVGGGRLTALVLDAKGRQTIHSVGCKDYRD